MFTIEDHRKHDKFFYILGPDPGDQFLRIDNDDVDHDEIKEMSERIVAILNDNWDKKQYAKGNGAFIKWFKSKFQEITEDILNGEEAVDVEMHGKDPLIIDFSVDAGRAGTHHGGRVRITKTKVMVTLPEIIEGAGIEEGLAIAIRGKVK